jgi:serine/threonine-protein kinase RsbW
MIDSGRHIVIPSDLSEARRFQEEIESDLASHFSEKELFAIKMALEEALVNAIKHGNQLDPDKSVHLHYSIKPGRFDIQITDEGPGFNPSDVPDPTLPENIERPCGRGLLLIRCYMTEVNFINAGRTIKMSKIKATPSDSPR